MAFSLLPLQFIVVGVRGFEFRWICRVNVRRFFIGDLNYLIACNYFPTKRSAVWAEKLSESALAWKWLCIHSFEMKNLLLDQLDDHKKMIYCFELCNSLFADGCTFASLHRFVVFDDGQKTMLIFSSSLLPSLIHVAQTLQMNYFVVGFVFAEIG